MANRINTKTKIETWYKASKSKVHSCVQDTVLHISRTNSKQTRLAKHHLKFYSNLNVAGKGSEQIAELRSRAQGRMRYNLCSSAVDTAASMIANEKPKPLFITDDGDFSLQRQAKLLTRVLEGQLDDMNAYENSSEVFIDAAVLGLGCEYGYIDPLTNKPKLERVFPLELHVDHNDGINKKPRNLFRTVLASKEVLLEQYPDKKKEIELSSSPGPEHEDIYFLTKDDTVEQIVLYYAWHLPSGPEANDGRFVLCTDKTVLIDEPWEEEFFPFVFYRWKKRQLGFFGVGIVEECKDAQWRINRLIKTQEKASDLCTTTWISVGKNDKISSEHIQNGLGTIVRTSSNTPPRIVAFNGTPTELERDIQNIREQTFSQLGISIATAQGQKPAGLTSGVALRAHDDINSRRLLTQIKGYEKYHVDKFKLLTWLNKQAVNEDGDLVIHTSINRGNSELLQQINWKEIDLPENKYKLRVQPISALPSTPAGKWATVQELLGSGMITIQTAQQLMDFPDLDSNIKLELAEVDSIMYDIDRMLDNDERLAPDPLNNIAFAIEMAKKSYLSAKIQGAPPEKLDLLREYIAAGEDMILDAQKEQQLKAQQQQLQQQAQQNALVQQQTTPNQPKKIQLQ